jgi:hypothetical protein
MSYLVQFLFFTGGIVFLTLTFNGSTTQFLLRLLGLDKLSAAKVCFVDSYKLSCPVHILVLPMFVTATVNQPTEKNIYF